MNQRRAVFDLFLASALGLFLELVFIRWAASELRVLAFYKNFALIGAFLGLGLGFAYRGRNPDKPLFERTFFPALLLSVVLIFLVGRTSLSELILLNRTNAQEFLWAGALNLDNVLVHQLLNFAFYAILLLLFLLITLLFIPLGELTARKFALFDPLPGYTINILGSATGILLYTVASYLRWPPPVWFALSALGGVYFLLADRTRTVAWQVAAALLPVVLTLFWQTGADMTLWSPYYRIDINAAYSAEDPSLQLGYELSVNQAWHQRLWNLAPDFVQAHYAQDPAHFDTYIAKYDTPYQAASGLDEVLVVGAGTGNDVAAGLRAGVGHIDAVEIDPLILEIGQQMHLERPYADPQRVDQIVQDARSFFRRSDKKYDLIVFGTLDSHTVLSTSSNVRLDNFVYTEESLQEVRNLLKPDGVLALSFGVPATNEWVGLRIFRTLSDAFGYAPQVFEFANEDILFLISGQPGRTFSVKNPNIKPRPDYTYQASLSPVTDDWPYMYLQTRTVPSTYLIALAGIFLISLFLTRQVIPNFRRVNLHFFFMGAAFFLLETKSITEMALLFGSTWIVNAVVILAIMMEIVAANLLVQRYRWKDPTRFYWLLAISILINFFVPVSRFLGLDLTLRVILAALLQVIPLFFAGIIFAITFSQTRSIESSLGSNLIGSVLGGLFEYVSLATGIRSLYLLALLFYLASLWALKRMEEFRKVGVMVPGD